ncbi:uncharacterized protein [Cherax quadricarinatus]|uniref:uncharacterized protein isoform X2 n=1 Tax=Cherax quadricarinatus TaxID=27406 RepID=UPI00387ED8E1
MEGHRFRYTCREDCGCRRGDSPETWNLQNSHIPQRCNKIVKVLSRDACPATRKMSPAYLSTSIPNGLSMPSEIKTNCV